MAMNKLVALTACVGYLALAIDAVILVTDERTPPSLRWAFGSLVVGAAVHLLCSAADLTLRRPAAVRHLVSSNAMLACLPAISQIAADWHTFYVKSFYILFGRSHLIKKNQLTGNLPLKVRCSGNYLYTHIYRKHCGILCSKDPV